MVCCPCEYWDLEYVDTDVVADDDVVVVVVAVVVDDDYLLRAIIENY
jgi:hypothetical protein